MTNRLPRVDTDGDDQIENANVDALTNLAASDAFSAYPLAIGTDTDHTASDHHDAGALEIDAANLAGALGAANEVLVSDGAALSYSLVGTANIASQAITATEVDGSGGTTGQVLDTDGTAAGVAWTLVNTSNLADQAVTPLKVDGSGGLANQVLQTDGTAAGVSWSDVSPSDDHWTTSTETASVTASDNDEVLADSSVGAVTITLPTPANGVRVRVVNIDNTNGVTVGRSGTESINGTAADITLSEFESVELVSNGTDWFIV